MTDQQHNQQPSVASDADSNASAAGPGAVGMAGAVASAEAATAAALTDAAGGARPRVFKMSDEFLMFKFKIEMCSRKDRHDWKICPYAHPGEVARRRHPRGYTAVLCPAKTAASCPRREQCTFAHNPFEFWLHPDRFKTSLCNQGPNCDRPICFFAHRDEEVRRLAHGLEAAGPDDYVYATAASTPEPDSGAAGLAPPPPPPPPPRMNLAHAGSGSLGYLQGNAMVAAAAAAAAAASLNSSGLLLGAGAASPHQLMLMNGEDALLQASGGLMPDASMRNSTWFNSNSDPSLMTSLTAAGRQMSATSPVPLPHPHSSGRGLRNSLTSASSMGMMAMSLDQAAAVAAGSYGHLDANVLAGMPLGHQLSNSSASLAAAVNMAGAKGAGMAGSAPAGLNMLQGDMSTPYQQLLQQQLQMEQQQQQQQMNQQQMLQDQLMLQQQLQALIQQQALVAGANGAGYQQLVQQQQAQMQQLQLQQQLQVQAQAQQQPQQQQVQQWHSSLLASQPLAAFAPSSQVLWQQQQHMESHLNTGSYGSSSSVTPPDGQLAAAAALASTCVATSRPSVVSPTQMASTAPLPSNYLRTDSGSSQQGMLKWSSSILSKRSSSLTSSKAPGQISQMPSGSQDLLGQASADMHRQGMTHWLGMQQAAEQPGSNGVSGDDAVVGLLGPAGGVLPASSSAATTAPSLDQLNGLLQMVHVSSSAAMTGHGGLQ